MQVRRGLSRREGVAIVKKGIIAGLLLLGTGIFFWTMIAGEIFNPAEKVAVKVDKENFDWFTCPSCSTLFVAEATAKQGMCPYCGFPMMLGIEQKRVLGTSVDESQFVSFFSPACNRVFFAYHTGEIGKCPYCGEPIALIVPETIEPEESPPALVAFVKANFRFLVLAIGLVIGTSVAGAYLLLQRRVILSLEPIAGTVAEEAKIELSKRQVKKKLLTLGPSPTADINIKHPSLDFNCTLSFVRVGGNMHAYLRRDSNLPIWVNDKPEYNAQLKDHDKVKLGDIIFEVHASKN
ncbi:MAG: hypothetical protein C4520_00610 [Candidatus Abyssobacteria bacterium SURF_5]|uniref:FHA domain-containing protein n=1 Tax=Abyssobacteria bacterium (strain SURF_5) TaxID=2093360 RepID=A0A3A4P6G0_ABYX5|nr:MAG: hypothetical protein C4520_00610 [Candidatus Abyssubacteria bacterium SURF_5]